MKTDPRNTLLEGVIAAEAAIDGGQREVFRVWMDRERDDAATQRLRKLCKQHGIRYSPSNRAALDEAAEGTSHGGVIVEVGGRRFAEVDELLNRPPTFVAMLDGIEDPFNFGQAVRALYAAGCTGLIVRPRNWTTAAATVARASAGATERIAMAVADTPEAAAEAAQAKGVMVVATGQADDAVPYHAVDYTGPVLLLIGGERRGLRRSFLAQCESVATIPYGQAFPAALGTVAATSVLAFEVARQRGDA